MFRPEFTVIAGPNGAGKSTLSAAMVGFGTFVYDGDKELARLQRRFPDISAGTLYESVTGILLDEKINAAINNKEDFAIETNFSSKGVMDIVNRFRDAGYRVVLIFIGLRSIRESLDRVQIRVNKGGHDVSGTEIRFNYEQGLKNFRKHYREFDKSLVVYNGTGKSAIRIRTWAQYESGKLAQNHPKIPEWVKDMIREQHTRPAGMSKSQRPKR